jgi:hypothetical protein
VKLGASSILIISHINVVLVAFACFFIHLPLVWLHHPVSNIFFWIFDINNIVCSIGGDGTNSYYHYLFGVSFASLAGLVHFDYRLVLLLAHHAAYLFQGISNIFI